MLEYRFTYDEGCSHSHSQWYTDLSELSLHIAKFYLEKKNGVLRNGVIESREYQPEEPRKKLIDF